MHHKTLSKKKKQKIYTGTGLKVSFAVFASSFASSALNLSNAKDAKIRAKDAKN